MTLSVCAPNNRTSKHTKPKWWTWEQRRTRPHSRACQPLLPAAASSWTKAAERQKNWTPPSASGRWLFTEYCAAAFPQKAPGTYTNIGRILGHKPAWRIRFVCGVISDHNELKLEVDNRKTSGKSLNIWKLNSDFWIAHVWTRMSRRKKKYSWVIRKTHMSQSVEHG